MPIKMFAPRKMEFDNGKFVFIGRVYDHPQYHDGKEVRTAFITAKLEDGFIDSDGYSYQVPDKEPIAKPPEDDYNWKAYE